MSGNGVEVIWAVTVGMLDEKIETVTVTHTTDSVRANCPIQRPGNIR